LVRVNGSDKYAGEKMTIHFKTLALTLIFSAFSLAAMAEEVSNGYNSYLSLSAGKSRSTGACATTYAPDANCSDKSSVYRLGFGHHFTPTWGMEISYGDFGRAKEEGIDAAPPSDVPGGGPIPYVWTFEAVGWEIAATGTMHMGKSFSLIGKLGFLHAEVGQEIIWTTISNGLWHSVEHENSNNISTGVGAQYDFNQDFALRIQYDKYGKLGKLSKIDVSAASARVILKF
jgi:hypothetical protein